MADRIDYEDPEALAAWDRWDRVGSYTTIVKQAFVAGYLAGVVVRKAILNAGPAAAEPGFLERTFGAGATAYQAPEVGATAGPWHIGPDMDILTEDETRIAVAESASIADLILMSQAPDLRADVAALTLRNETLVKSLAGANKQGSELRSLALTL